jgi:hypothetical protein
LVSDESVRVKNRIADGLASRRWEVPAPLRTECARTLAGGFVLGGDGIVKAR